MIETMLVFDMDGVLIEPRGYHRALQETVRLIGHSLGFENPHMDQGTIHAFEAAGISSEWDTAAICLGVMMKEIWQQDPGAAIPTKLNPSPPGASLLQAPDWEGFLSRMGSYPADLDAPLQKARELLNENLTESQRAALTGLMEGTYDVRGSLTNRVFQELVLGSGPFQDTYQLTPWFDCGGYLQRFDRPLLTPQQVEQLKDLLGEKIRAAIVTNRPSQSPEEFVCSPEAEIGARALELAQLPLVGFGDMLWLSKKREEDIHDFLKPSPVHLLAALLQARGIPRKKALETAANFAHHGLSGRQWQAYQGCTLYLFEDTTAGMRSATSAVQYLKDQGVEIELALIGIAADGQKQGRLRSLGARVYPALGEALQALFGIR